MEAKGMSSNIDFNNSSFFCHIQPVARHPARSDDPSATSTHWEEVVLLSSQQAKVNLSIIFSTVVLMMSIFFNNLLMIVFYTINIAY